MGQWTEITVAGHPADVFEPSQPHQAGSVVLFLHGVHIGRLPDKPVYTAEFERHGLRVISPITRRSWWTDRICPEFDPRVTAERHLLDGVLPYIAERWGARPPRIGLLGTSMGGQGALRLAYKHPQVFPVVAAVSPAIDYQIRWYEDDTIVQMYDDPEAVRQDTATLHVHPLNWPRHQFFCCDPRDERWYDSSDRLRMKLQSLGIAHECDLETSGGGHGWPYYNLMGPKAIGFLVERLEQERMRVV
jgi:pimeloyl-ACP methyl ester carboxylesterase